MSDEEEVPISDYYEVLTSYTLRKSDKWWTAVVCVRKKGDEENKSASIRLYRWQKKQDKWTKSGSFNINRKTDWERIKKKADEFVDIIWAAED
ncbi:MAG: hypothetical protein ACFFBD_02515 [Candidatus Hodarchaeota archaeon]